MSCLEMQDKGLWDVGIRVYGLGFRDWATKLGVQDLNGPRNCCQIFEGF